MTSSDSDAPAESQETKQGDKEARRCHGLTVKGTACRNRPLAGHDYCLLHTPKTQGEKWAELGDEPPPPPKTVGSWKEFFQMAIRRHRGRYDVDDLGLDQEFLEQFRPLARWVYHKYWRVTVTGIENVPAEGRALLVANHSGVLPFDGAMVIMAVQEEHPHPRLVRALVLSLFFKLPFTAPMLAKTGQVQANPANSERLLNNDELALVFPEGVKGIGKTWNRRYRLARFGRGGFVRVALKTRSPIIPVSIVGAEEIYPNLMNLKPLANLFGLPYVPITPFFPWLGPLGLIPLPTRWYIHFDAPVPIPDMNYRRSEEPLLMSKISNQVRDTIQRNIYERLKTRRSVFW